MSGRCESKTKRAGLSAFARVSTFATAALFAAAISLLVPAPVRADPVVGELNLNASNGYLRLVLRFPRPVDTQVRLSGSILVIGFAEPVDISVDRLNLGATNYIGAARRDPDGRAIRVALSRNVTFNITNAAEQVFIDLLPESWSGPPPGLPREVVEELARRTREAERVNRVQQQILQNRKTTPVRVRMAKMPTFVRYVFELPDLTGVTTERGKDMLTLVFAAPLRFDLADARLDLPPVVQAIESEIGLDVSRVKFAFKDSVDIRAFREDNNYVVDFTSLESKVARAADKDSADKAQTQSETQTPADTQPAAEPGKSAEETQTGQENQAAETPQAAPKSESDNPSAAEKQASAPSASPPAAPQQLAAPKPAPAAPLDAAGAEPSTDPQRPVTVQLSRQSDTLRLRFPFAAQTPAAVFQRADMLWLVFDTATKFDVSPLDNESSGTVGGVSVISTGEGQAVRIKLERPRLVGAIADGNAWIITIGDTIAQPSKPLGINRSIVGPSRASITIPIDDPRRLHRLVDPDLGDTLLVVTAPGPARGFLKTQEFVELRTLASTHGIAVEMLADDLSAELSVDKIVLRRPTGLSLSGSSGVTRRSDRSRAVLFDTQAWGSDHHANFIDRQRNLIQAAADAPVGKRTQPRLELVRFYLAQGMYVEAKAVLDVIIADDRQTTEDPTALVLRAVANLMFERADSALKDLSHPAVGNQQDAQLWRAIAYSQQGKWPEAVEGFRTVEGAMGTLPIELQLVALRDAMRVAIEVGDYGSAMRRLNDMDSVGVPAEMEPVVAVLQGRLAEGLGRNEDALASYGAAAGSPNRPAAAQGHLRELALRYALGAVKKPDIVGELESLTATWRGDETEIEALNYLAQFYTEDARYRDAFNMMRQANVANPNSDMTRKIQDRAAATFNALFLVGKGDTMPAIDALSLFYDFRDLVPIGRRGDEMIRRLADRLVAVDLLDQAAELLQHQVDNRLQGAARAQVATKLALIYLLNHKPEQAQATLRATRTAELSTDMRNQRLLIEARALSDIGRHELALEIVDNMDSPEAVRLRSDIQWAARRWQRSAEQMELLYGNRWKEFEPLSDVERVDILRAAVGYALGNDAIGISRLKEKFAAKMAEGPDRRAFEVATGGYGTNSAEFRDVVRSVASVDTLDAFVRDMRKRYPEIGAPPEPMQPVQSPPAPAPVKTENKGAATPPA